MYNMSTRGAEIQLDSLLLRLNKKVRTENEFP